MLSVVTVIVVCAVVTAVPTTNSRHRVIGGKDATIEDHPYQVAIELDLDQPYFLCGGSIISKQFIVSAAHPFCEKSDLKKESYIARVGSSNREKEGQAISFSSDQINIHPSYEYDTNDYDVAVVKLTESIKFSHNAKPISLIPINEEIADGTKLIVTGYGQTSVEGDVPEKLQVAMISKQNSDLCAKLINRNLTDRMLCAGDGKSTPFRGDSGGPLINEQRQLVGIVSWGRSEPTEKNPAVYTKVSNADIYNFIVQYAPPAT